ncbi:MAG TPA: threonine/serine dehydratase [Ferrovibrio sp.]|uniref:threonine ammonia-lyase n=1 Tax=Ferrovibrio sp. TaxID=1917215 RepID=UPI002B4B7A0D|nr:threonine/serine dehydratase [Ferrovibrio sp.]HLT75971.1 threonine/serine dehydratase [Ferrovibrio sp.]
MNAPAKLPLPTVADVEDAARQLRGVAVRTPLLENPYLNERLGGRLLIKAEPLQVTGSFKFRGAYNRISRLNPEERKRGIVAFSSGNHAQACAWAAKITNTPAVIVMPSDAPKIKISNTRAYGAEVVLYDRQNEDREAIGRRYSEERGMTLVPPFNDPYIISGQGTIGLEIAAQCAERDIKPDAVLAPASGGGLISGISLAIRDRLPGTDVYCAEPDQFDDIDLSLKAGRIVSHAGKGTTFCDALMAPHPGDLTFGVMNANLKGAVSATDAEVETAMATTFHYFKLVVEPGGACALASVLNGKLSCANRIVVVVTSGGNVDSALYSAIIGRASPV